MSSEALMALTDQITVLLRLPEHAVPSNEAYDPIHDRCVARSDRDSAGHTARRVQIFLRRHIRALA